MNELKFTIDGKECRGKQGQTILEAAGDNGIYIPVLCNYQGLKPAGACRICTVRADGRFMAACTTPLTDRMMIENKTEEIEGFRKAIIEMLFVEGNHFCPACEKSGSCELQALGYLYRMTVPRFPYQFPERKTDGSISRLIMDHNRCIQCLRCVRGVKTQDGKNIFGLINCGKRTRISFDPVFANNMSDEQAKFAMDICPVGTILKKEIGFAVPIGRRKFDSMPIGRQP